MVYTLTVILYNLILQVFFVSKIETVTSILQKEVFLMEALLSNPQDVDINQNEVQHSSTTSIKKVMNLELSCAKLNLNKVDEPQ